MNKNIDELLQRAISACFDDGDYDPAEDRITDPTCRLCNRALGEAVEVIENLRDRVNLLEDFLQRVLPVLETAASEDLLREVKNNLSMNKILKEECLASLSSAYNEGWKKGYLDEDKTCLYPTGGRLAIEWCKGYNDGEKEYKRECEINKDKSQV